MSWMRDLLNCRGREWGFIINVSPAHARHRACPPRLGGPTPVHTHTHTHTAPKAAWLGPPPHQLRQDLNLLVCG